jgi:hypothetical protein
LNSAAAIRRMAPVKSRAMIAILLTALAVAAIAGPALAAEVEFAGPISGVANSADGTTGVDFDATVKKGEIVSIESGVFVGLELECGGTKQPLDINLGEPATVTAERFDVREESDGLTVTIRGRFTARGTKANGTVSAIDVGAGGRCATGTHTWRAAKG